MRKAPSKYYFDEKAANKVIDFIERFITHVKGENAGKPLLLEDWQKDDIIRPLFGWKDKLTGLRKYRTLYVEIPRKNAKSTLTAGMGLYLLAADGEPGAEIYSAAADRGQAGIIFDVASRMVEQKRALKNRLGVFRNSITHEKTGSFYKVISAESSTKHGFNAHAVLFDEFHTQKDRKLYEVLTTSVGSRRQPLVIILTTAGFDRTSICYELHEYARKVQEGIIEDETFLGVIYTTPDEMDIFSRDTWKLANPGFGTIVKEDYIASEANKVRNNPNHENAFRQLHLNQWVSNIYSWIPDPTWMKCNIMPLDISDFKDQDCFLGLDLASTDDTCSLVAVFPDQEDENMFHMFLWVWIPEEMVNERARRGDMLYRNWVDQKLMIQTPGNVTDYDFIKNKILELNENHHITSIGFDKWNSSQMIVDLMKEIDESVFDKVEMGIGSMSEPSKRFYKMVKQTQLNHGGNPIFRWMMSNVMIYQDANENIKPSKKSSKDKIDGVVSAIIAFAAYWSGDDGDVDVNEYYSNQGLR